MIKACGCPGTYPDWHNQDVDLGGQCVHVLPIPTFLHMPLAYSLYAKRQQEIIDQLQLPERWPGFTLTQTGILRGRILRLLESNETPARRIEYLPRPFHVRGYLHRGSVGNIRLPVHQMSMDLLEAGRRTKELYLSYLTCPRCRGDDQPDKILLLRRWIDSPGLKKRAEKERLKKADRDSK
jgi:hypothetical protein